MGFLGDGIKELGGRGLTQLARLKWVFIGILIVVALIALIWFLTVARKKKHQWTHKFKVRRVYQDGSISDVSIHKARRFPLEKGVEVFELEKPILGSFIIPQTGEYVGNNEFSIILDSNNRIWNDKGTKFNKEKQSFEVSAVHAGVDVEMAALKEKWQQAHKINKKITTLELIKAGLKALGIIAVIIISIVALQQWGDAQLAKASVAQAEAQAMTSINEAVITMEKVVNTQQLQIIPMLQALYGKENIAEEINKYRPEELKDEAV